MNKRWVSVPMLLFVSVSTLAARDLTFEQRVEAQKAIERVYWNHRLWPAQNPRAKPPLETVLPTDAIRARVQDYLKKSEALETFWGRPVRSAQLQAEMNRMARHTRDAQMLQELFDALGNDSFLIAETLARRSLVERLLRNWHADDERAHSRVKSRLQAALAKCDTVSCMRSLGGVYRETTWRLRREESPRRTPPAFGTAVDLDPAEWDAHMAGLSGDLGAAFDLAPLMKLGPLVERDDAFVVTAVLSRAGREHKLATIEWEKESFGRWWSNVRISISGVVPGGPDSYELPSITMSTCTPDQWTATAAAPDPRSSHTAVWTGSEMIVWGGGGNFPYATGGRYVPATDTWMPTNEVAAPTPRAAHSAVWTGTEMIIWGGGSGLRTGGRYSPASDSWTPTNEASAPSARANHTAIWTGSEMIVWGGAGGGLVNSGGRYSPASNSWAPTSLVGAPDPRYRHTAVWTGTEMIVWGGFNQGSAELNTGGRYAPSTNSWTTTTTTGAPVPRGDYSTVWTGTELIIWGGFTNFDRVNSGGRYSPSTNTWTTTSTASCPTARRNHTAVWTGDEMVVWGGDGSGTNGDVYFDSGGRYSPASNSWAPTNPAGAPSPRSFHTALWTGSEMIIWGGLSPGLRLNSGGRYSTASNTWTPTSTEGAPEGRLGHSAIWTGTEMIVWGGAGSPPRLRSGGRYSAVTDEWLPMNVQDAPSARAWHTAVWMVVFMGGIFLVLWVVSWWL